MAYEITNKHGVLYQLRETTVTLNSGKESTIYYLVRKDNGVRHTGEPCDLPDGYQVKENPRTGFLSVWAI